jgi:DNA (cytosine-5)-methyltransferase 1
MRTIDLFAGAGGFTAGATQAGAQVLWAANHWPAAVETHAANHPEVAHACQDLTQADFSQVPDHDLLMASPACQGHAKARGAERPHHDALRSTAWAVIACVEAQRPRSVMVENVPEFLDWQLFDVWALALEKYGYHVTTQVLDSADFGVCQERKRAFVMAHQDRPLHLAAPREAARVALGQVIDWDAGRWSAVSAKVPATVDQVARAQAKHGDRCAIVYNGSRNAGRSLEAPAPTITTVDRLAIVDGDRMRMLTLDEYRECMGFERGYHLARRKKDAIKLLGNAVCPPVARDLVGQVMAA